ncbi:MAG: hypothetical protein ACP5NE_01180 [Candidatus Micrarchaeia archaeon]
MVKISFSPIKELVVHDLFKMSYEDLMRGNVTSMGNLPLYWCDGILYRFNSIPMNRELSKQYLDGVLHWAEVHYADNVDEYKPIMEVKDENYQGGYLKIRVIDMSKSELHRDFIKWLKSSKGTPSSKDKQK